MDERLAVDPIQVAKNLGASIGWHDCERGQPRSTGELGVLSALLWQPGRRLDGNPVAVVRAAFRNAYLDAVERWALANVNLTPKTENPTDA